MIFNRADDIWWYTVFLRYLVCLIRDHVWGEWHWRVYRDTEYRICGRCGLTEDRLWFPEPFIGRGMHDDGL